MGAPQLERPFVRMATLTELQALDVAIGCEDAIARGLLESEAFAVPDQRKAPGLEDGDIDRSGREGTGSLVGVRNVTDDDARWANGPTVPRRMRLEDVRRPVVVDEPEGPSADRECVQCARPRLEDVRWQDGHSRQ